MMTFMYSGSWSCGSLHSTHYPGQCLRPEYTQSMDKKKKGFYEDCCILETNKWTDQGKEEKTKQTEQNFCSLALN